MEHMPKSRFQPFPKSKMAIIKTDRRSFNQALIYLVKKSPVIWDTRRSDYKNSRRMGYIWNDIAYALNSTAQHVSYRWRNLRDTFRKQLRKVEDGKEYIRWSYFEQLKFLISPMESQRNIENHADDTTDAQDQDDSESAEIEEINDQSQYSFQGEMITEESRSIEINEESRSIEIPEESRSIEIPEESRSIEIHEEPSLPCDIKRDLLSLEEQSFDGDSPGHSVTYDVEPDSSTLRGQQSTLELDYCILQQLHQTSLLLTKNEAAMKTIASQLRNKKQDSLEHFLLSLLPGLKETPPELLPSLQMHLIYIISKYKQGIVPTNLPNLL